MLDDAHLPATSAVVDEACGLKGNALMVGEDPSGPIRALYVGFYDRGPRRKDLEVEDLGVNHPIDERVPRVRALPDRRIVHVISVYTAEELKTSPTYDEFQLRSRHQDSLAVRMDGRDGAHMTWGLGDPVASH